MLNRFTQRPTVTLALVTFLLSIFVAGAAQGEESVFVIVGGKEVITLDDYADSVVLPEDGIVDVNRGDTKKILVVRGLKQGQVAMQVTLSNGDKLEYQISVSDPSVLRAAHALVSKIPGVKAEIKGGKVIVGGEVRSVSAANRLAGAKRSYPGVIVDASRTKLPSKNAVIKTINKVLVENDIANIQAASYGRLIVLQGSPKDEAQRNLALRIAKMIYVDIEDHTEKNSNGAPALSIEVVFIEVQRKGDKTIGFQGALGGDVSNGQITTPKEGEAPIRRGVSGSASGGSGQYGKMNWAVGPLSTFIKMIETRSVSRVLSNPKLVARSGEEAEFHSGGTFYIPTSTTKGSGVEIQSLEAVDYGIILNIMPKLDPLGQIDAKILTSISDLGAKIADQQSITRSEVKTAVTIRDGQSILLSGLVRKVEKKKVDRVPLLADIPVVGELFKSRRKETEETELLVLVTMSRVQASDERIKAAGKLWERSGEDVKFSVFD